MDVTLQFRDQKTLKIPEAICRKYSDSLFGTLLEGRWKNSAAIDLFTLEEFQMVLDFWKGNYELMLNEKVQEILDFLGLNISEFREWDRYCRTKRFKEYDQKTPKEYLSEAVGELEIVKGELEILQKDLNGVSEDGLKKSLGNFKSSVEKYRKSRKQIRKYGRSSRGTYLRLVMSSLLIKNRLFLIMDIRYQETN